MITHTNNSTQWLKGLEANQLNIMTIKLCWFNQCWNVYITSKLGHYSHWDTVSTVTKRKHDESGVYRLSTYKVDDILFYSYGFMEDSKDRRPGHGGEWSSRCEVINVVFGINLTEVGVDGIAMSVDIDQLITLLGDKYVIVKTDYGHHVMNTDGNTDHKDHTWITI